MQELIPQIGAPVVDANLYKYGSSEPCFAPYIIRYYGARSVAFVGALAPGRQPERSFLPCWTLPKTVADRAPILH